MAVDPKKNLEDIGFMIYELKNIYALTDDPKIDITLPDPFTTIEEIASDSSTATEPEYKRLKDYDGNININILSLKHRVGWKPVLTIYDIIIF